jgi:hypothetical protein
MGRSYFVPRSVKGESRILYIFTIKSFVFTLAFGVIGAAIWYFLSAFINLIPGLILTGILGGIGYVIGAAKIPDVPFMGPFRKAGGENLSDIIFRFITFRGKKKIYIYNLNRNNKGGK